MMKKISNDHKPPQKQLEILVKYYQAGQYVDAEKLAILITQEFPKHAFTWTILGDALRLNGKRNDSLVALKKSLELNPQDIATHNSLSNTLQDLKKFDKAEKSYKNVISLNPKYFEAHHNLGTVLRNLGKLKESEESYKRAISLKPDFAEAYYNSGLTLQMLEKFDDAEARFKKTIILKSDFAPAYYSLGNNLKRKEKFEEAVTSYKNAIKFEPDHALAYNNLGITLKILGRNKEAETCYNKAIEYKPDYALAYYNLGSLLIKLNKLEEAEANYKKAIEYKPDYAFAYYNLGNLYKILKITDKALICYDTAYLIKPDTDYLMGELLYVRMQLGIWNDFSKNIKKLIKNIDSGKKLSTPFPLMVFVDNPLIHQKAAEVFSTQDHPKNNIFKKIIPYPNHKKIKIAYFSPDFRSHPVSFLTAGLYELHDRSKFEIHAFSLKLRNKDEFNQRVSTGVDYFHNVQMMSDQDIVKLSRSLEIDIAIDLAGYTAGSRTDIFAMSAAPIQVSYLGFPGTMGANYMNYLIADKTIIPEQNKKYYSENIVYLPSYQINDTKVEASKKVFTRKDLGLPLGSFVFCCFNNTHKITPQTFNSWARILRQVDNSVLMLYAKNETVIKNLKKEIKDRGINPNKLIFVQKLARPEFLARFRVIDLFLDTSPHNAGATASDALRMEVPVLTQMGESFASRMAASLLKAVNLPELITTTQDEYELLAINLATNSKKFKYIKDKLIYNLPSAALFNTLLSTRNLEKAYHIMYKRYHDGLDSGDIEVE